MLEYEAGKRLSQHWHERPIFSLKTGFLTGCVRMPKSTLHLIKKRNKRYILHLTVFHSNQVGWVFSSIHEIGTARLQYQTCAEASFRSVYMFVFRYLPQTQTTVVSACLMARLAPTCSVWRCLEITVFVTARSWVIVKRTKRAFILLSLSSPTTPHIFPWWQ